MATTQSSFEVWYHPGDWYECPRPIPRRWNFSSGRFDCGPLPHGRKATDDFHGGPHGYFLRFFEVTAGDITNVIIHVGHGTTLKGTLRAVGGNLPVRMNVHLFIR